MAQEFNSAKDESKYTPSPAQLDLLAALLSSENSTYPWNHTDPEAESYFAEQEPCAPELSPAEIEVRSQQFYSELEQLWSKATPKRKISPDTNRVGDWQPYVTTYVPESWLEEIACQAKQVFRTQSSLAEKLVQCVHNLIPSLVEEDLLVLARPFATTMPSAKQESQDVITQVQHGKWDELSEIEQAKASLAIARYVLAHMKVAESSHCNGLHETS